MLQSKFLVLRSDKVIKGWYQGDESFVEHDRHTNTKYFQVPFQDRTVIRQDFNQNGKQVNKHYFETFLVTCYCYEWSGVDFPSIIAVSKGDREHPFIIYDTPSMSSLRRSFCKAQASYHDVPEHPRVYEGRTWHTLSEYHGITLLPQLANFTLFPMEEKTKVQALWSLLTDNLGQFIQIKN